MHPPETCVLVFVLPAVISQLIGLALSVEREPTDYMEFCQTEVFNATCDPVHMILMTHARYGRMQRGRCVKQNYGHLGCSSDALPLADERCTGKSSCSIAVPDPLFDKTQHGCPEDLKPYLEVGYICVKVSQESSTCNVEKTTNSSGNISGYLLNTISHLPPEYLCGTYNAPWSITSDVGQQILLTLYDLDTRKREMNSLPYSACHLLALVREYAENLVHNITVCGRNAREVVLLETQANKVEIITRPSILDKDRYFIKYQVLGCGPPKEPPNTWVIRSGDTATLRCNRTQQTSQLTCRGNSWYGEHLNCTAAPLPASTNDHDSEAVPLAISVVVVILIAVVIGLIVLSFGLLFIRRQHMCSRPANPMPDTVYVSNKDYGSATYYQKYSKHMKSFAPVSDPASCTPLMASSMYGQLPARMSCGCTVYVVRNKLNSTLNPRTYNTSVSTYDSNSGQKIYQSRSSSIDYLDELNNEHKTFRRQDYLPPFPKPADVPDGPDLTKCHEIESSHDQLHSEDDLPPPTVTKGQQEWDSGEYSTQSTDNEVTNRLKLDNILNEAKCDDIIATKNDSVVKTQIVKPMNSALHIENKAVPRLVLFQS